MTALAPKTAAAVAATTSANREHTPPTAPYSPPERAPLNLISRAVAPADRRFSAAPEPSRHVPQADTDVRIRKFLCTFGMQVDRAVMGRTPIRELLPIDLAAGVADEAVQVARPRRRLLAAHNQISNLFHRRRDEVPTAAHQTARARAFDVWAEMLRSARSWCSSSPVVYLRHHNETELDRWLDDARDRGIPVVVNFARTLIIDIQAVRNAVIEQWSTDEIDQFFLSSCANLLWPKSDRAAKSGVRDASPAAQLSQSLLLCGTRRRPRAPFGPGFR